MKKAAIGALGVGATVAVMAGPAFGHECTNASRNANNPSAGAQLVLGVNGDPIFVSNGLSHRIEMGLVDPATGEGYHGLVGLDFDGDGVADASTYIVGPNDEIPDQAQFNGSPDHGIVNICGPQGC